MYTDAVSNMAATTLPAHVGQYYQHKNLKLIHCTRSEEEGKVVSEVDFGG
jgi:hypothetical protein